MSKLETNTIDTISGSNTLTLGSSNLSTINMASGVSPGTGMGKILNVVQATTSTAVSVTGSTFTDTTLTASITPISASNKILVLVNQSYSLSRLSSTYVLAGVRLLRDTTSIWDPNQEDSNGSYGLGIQITGQTGTYIQRNFVNYNYLDSPSTTSATTYKTQIRGYTGTGIATAQQAGGTNNGASTIILMEVSA